MELLQLQYFVKVAETGNITQAAKELYVSQPALSVTIARLERDISVSLFQRSANRISLTPSGQEFLKYARSALDTLEAGVAAARKLGSHERTDVHVVSALGVARHIIGPFSQIYPDVDVSLGLFNDRAIKKSLVNGKADFGISLGPVDDERLENQLVMRGRVCVAVGTNNPKYIGRDSVSIRELLGEQLFCSRLAETEQLTRKIFAAHSMPCDVMSLDEKVVLFAAAEKNLGLVVCLPMMYDQASGYTHNIRTIRFMLIDDVTDCWEVYLVHRKGQQFDEHVQALYDMSTEHFRENNDMLQKFINKVENNKKK